MLYTTYYLQVSSCFTCGIHHILKKIIFLLFSILCATNILAQNTASIKGHVLDADTDEHLPGVTILIEDSEGIGAATDETGHFDISNLKNGTYNLVIRYIGYKTTRERVYLNTGQQKHISIYLTK